MSFIETEFAIMAIYVVLAASFDLIIGRGGMFSISHAAFFAIGAYTAAQLNAAFGVPILLGWVAAAALSALLSLLLAAVAVRVTSDYLIIASFGFLTIVLAVIANAPVLTGGNVGISGIPAPAIGPFSLDSTLSYAIAYVLLAALVVVFLLYLVRSPFGRSLKAIRDSQSGAEALGKRPSRAKLWVFSIAGAFAGIAGAMYASFISYISPDAFGSSVNTLIFAMVFVGGAGSILGAVIGAIVLTWVPALISLASLPPALLGSLEQIAYGVVLVGIVIGAPGGLSQLGARLFRRRGQEVAR